MTDGKIVGVIGCGIWGKNIVRNFYNLGALHTVCDLDDDTLKMINETYKGTSTTKDFNTLLNSKEKYCITIIGCTDI